MSDETLISANAFGVEFPVCSEHDKVTIESAYKQAVEWLESEEGKAYDALEKFCACGMISRLLTGTVSRGDMVSLGIEMARGTYTKKAMVAAILDMASRVQDDQLQSHPVMSDTPAKKEWIN